MAEGRNDRGDVMAESLRPLMLALLLALAMLGLPACNSASPSSSPASSPTSGVQGRAMWEGGPAVANTGTPSGAPSTQQGHLSGVAIAVHEDDLDGKIVARVKADSSGEFKVELPVGRYTLVQEVPGATPETVRVEPGEFVTITLWDHGP